MNLGPAWLIVAAACGYALAYRRVRRRDRPSARRALAFLGGLAALGVALAGPLDTLADALFVGHMVQHMLLTIVVPPLVAAGQPLRLAVAAWPDTGRAASRLWLARSSAGLALKRLLVHLVPLAISVNVPLLLWHLPPAYEAALAHRVLHDLEHLTFLVPSLLLWVALLEPAIQAGWRPGPVSSLLLLFAAWMVCDALGATLALSQVAWYPSYAEAARWGLTPLADQHLGGLVMWIGGGLFYGAAMLVTLVQVSGVRGPRPCGEPLGEPRVDPRANPGA